MVGGLTLTLVAVAGCSSSETPSAVATPTTSSPSSSPTLPDPPATPTPTPMPLPVEPRAPKRLDDDVAGRRAFATYVVELWAYAIATNDSRPLVSLSPKGSLCEGCKPLKGELDRRAKAGWRVALSGVKVGRVTVPRKSRKGRTTVKAAIAIPESNTVTEDGTLTGVSPAHPDAVFEVTIEYSKRSFHLLSFTIRA